MLAANDAASPLDESPAPTITQERAPLPDMLGPYRIEAPLGQGGMGRVYRATDTRLHRSVAIKIPADRFSERFEREARAIAALNHPHICTLHDVGPSYLVMELVDGETLAARLRRGRLTLEQTVEYGAQIASALAAAHAHGIVHRDLKPANIMLTKSGVKLLDFGLSRSSADVHATAEWDRMGTPAYMAPEQFNGQAGDARADIYSFGLVLYEMATGARPSSEPLSAQPPALDRLVKRCLQEDPDDRWQSARDLEWELKWILTAPAAVPARSRYGLFGAALGLMALLAAALTVIHFRESPQRPEPVRMSLLLPEKSRVRALEVSPDGRQIAMVLVKDGKQSIWVRALDASEAVALAGTEGAGDPFWSPDSRFIGFFADAKLKKVGSAGGPVQILCDALAAVGGTWNSNGDILFGGLIAVEKVSESGGKISELPGRPGGVFPVFLPDGRHFLSVRIGAERPGIWLHAVDSAESRRIIDDASKVEVVDARPGSAAGALVFTRAGTLMSLPFDMKRLASVGEPVPIARQVTSRSFAGLAACSRQSVLAYVSGARTGQQYVWRDRHGKYLGTAGPAGGVVCVSPDGKRLVGDLGSTRVLDLATGVATDLMAARQGNTNPIWSPDGKYVAISFGKQGWGVYRKPATGAGEWEPLTLAERLTAPKSWSPDGRFIVYAEIRPGTGADLMAIPAQPNATPFALAQTPATEDQGQFSPDGHWVAYTSNESGLSEIYVIPFPPAPGGGRWRVSNGGGVMPRWRHDGKELFYISPDSQMMAVDVATKSVFQSGNPHPLFQTDIVDTGIRTGPMSWDIAPDGRFLIISETSTDTSITVVLNWRTSN